MSSNLVESLIGLLVLISAAWFLLFVQSRTEIDVDDSYVLAARFDRVDGLSTGSDVRLSGIKVGTITKQFLDKETYQAVIEFSVDKTVELPIDTAAAITSEGLLGGSYLSLIPGGFDEMLVDGEEIAETQDAVDLVGLIGKFMYGGNEAPSQ